MTMQLAGKDLTFSNGPISSQASGYVVINYGDNVIMGNATISKKGKEGASFFPMVVDFVEHHFAAGKIKTSRFMKRGGRPSENATLTSRLIDRPLRPLFPKGMTNEVQIIVDVLATDQQSHLSPMAINAASTALMLSGAPFEGPVSAVRVGMKDGQFILNPTYEECEEGDMNLVVAGTLDAIAMVEAGMNEITEEKLLEAFDFAHGYIKELCQFQQKYVAQFEIEKIEAAIVLPAEAAKTAVENFVTDEMLDSIKGTSKKEVKTIIEKLEEELLERYASEIENDELSKGDLIDWFVKFFEKRMRYNILNHETRLDGRKIDEVRPLSVNVDVLPHVHGAATFQRGETMSLSVATLGGPNTVQLIDTMDQEYEKRYFHHYSFPPYSVGEVRMLRGAGRREIGHGDLAERALMPVLPDSSFPYTMWVHSQITACNGSSSMASVCGSTLSLMAAGVPIKRPVSGIAMGLVSDSETGNYKILTDIQGQEDFAGDMDFKVTGTTEGITALQMDIKIKGLSLDLMREALAAAGKGRQEILDAMLAVIPQPRPEISPNAPLIMNIQINPEKIGAVIGKGGETIQGIIKECEVEIDINDDGQVNITAPKQENGKKAIEMIEALTYEPKVGDILDAKVVKILDFGAICEIAKGTDGMVHISELADYRVGKVEDEVKMGDVFKVKVLAVDPRGKISLSKKAAALGAGTNMKEVAKNNGGGKPGVNKSHHSFEEAKSRGEIVPGTKAVRKVNGA